MIDTAMVVSGTIVTLAVLWVSFLLILKRMNNNQELRMKRLDQDHEIVRGLEDE